MIQKGSQRVGAARTGALSGLSCTCMKTTTQSGQAWRGYERAVVVIIEGNFQTILDASVMWFGFWSNWFNYSVFWVCCGCYLALLVYDCFHCGWCLP
ncbi:hypothetical protein [Enterobacter sp. C4G1]|uniref:hypothetical protein n=1 Tax=Enterobacter sp. C4G1 TaxID=3458724 RepID=UPI004067D5E8